MLKGEKIGLIPVGKNYAPGQAVAAVVRDVKNGIVTCETIPFSGISTTTFVVEDYFEAMFVQAFLGGDPAIIQLKGDDVMKDLFSEESLKPKFNRKTLRYEYAMPQSALEEWVKAGVLVKEKVDWHYACRDCDTMVTVREGCYNCYATTEKKSKLMRHNKCGYIGFGKQFDDWKCPNCKEQFTATQGEFETVLGPAKCEACGYADVPTQIAGCLGCGNFFPLRDTKEMPVFKYRRAAPILTQICGATV